jgi:hypothetical protein
MIHHLFPEIDSEIEKTRPELPLQGLNLDLGNAPAYNSRQWAMNVTS